MLNFPNFNKVFHLQTDSHGMALGTELYQLLQDEEHAATASTSKVLRGPELRYNVTERELLVIIFSLQRFRMLLLGHRVITRTEHHAL